MLVLPGSILFIPFSFGPSLKHVRVSFALSHKPIKRSNSKFYPVPQLSISRPHSKPCAPEGSNPGQFVQCFPWVPLMGFLLKTMVLSFLNNPGSVQVRALCLNGIDDGSSATHHFFSWLNVISLQ